MPADSDAIRQTPYKRPFDLTLVVLVGVLFAPVWLAFLIVVSFAIWMEDRGRVFLLQRRLGRAGVTFHMVKFRTMIKDAERHTGPVLATDGEARSTRVGVWLRHLHLDETPQIINVLKGEMSLVGPRPERPELAGRIAGEVPHFADRLCVRPGIAGLAQAYGDYDTPPRNKLRYDKLYIRRLGPFLDLKLLARCAWKAVRKARRREAHSGRARLQRCASGSPRPAIAGTTRPGAACEHASP